jgi:hypothetical protein
MQKSTLLEVAAMLQLQPLSLHSRILLLQLRLQCQAAQRQLSQYRQASTKHTPKSTAVNPPKPQAPQSIPPPTTDPNPLLDPFANPRSKNAEDYLPKPLSRPLGLPNPPRPGENTGIDPRTWRQRRDDFVNYEKHLERRRVLYVPSMLNVWKVKWKECGY